MELNGLSVPTGARAAMHEIRERIDRQEYSPGTRLPREIDLAAELGVSRSALREAIRALELVGVLRSKHGSGTYVTSLEAHDLLRGLGFSNTLFTVESAVELAEFRRVTEPQASALAARRATAEQKARIRAIYEQMEQITDPQEYARIDPIFHQAILEASQSSVLVAVSSVLTYGVAWRRMWQSVTRGIVPEQTRREHGALLLAIETGDEELALATAHAHIAQAQRRIAEAQAAARGVSEQKAQA
jgi:GntR family transcriptional repressor for pyruvate dehydrogenase complex